jgi:hypothetical protein
MPTIGEVFGIFIVLVIMFVLACLGAPKRKHKGSFNLVVIYYCKTTGNQFVTAVSSIDLAQVYVNTLNLSTISSPMLVNRKGQTTHVLEAGVWSPVSQ